MERKQKHSSAVFFCVLAFFVFPSDQCTVYVPFHLLDFCGFHAGKYTIHWFHGILFGRYLHWQDPLFGRWALEDQWVELRVIRCIPWRCHAARKLGVTPKSCYFCLTMLLSKRWFQKLFIFTPIWGRFPFWLIFFQMGWNHQPVIVVVGFCWLLVVGCCKMVVAIVVLLCLWKNECHQFFCGRNHSRAIRDKMCDLHPGRLTWNLKMMVWKMIFLFNWVVFRFHVNLPGCSSFFGGGGSKHDDVLISLGTCPPPRMQSSLFPGLWTVF